MTIDENGNALIRKIKADLSNRGRSPKSANVTVYAREAVAMECTLELTLSMAGEQNLGCRKVAAQILSLNQLPKSKSLQQIAIGFMKDQSWEIREYAPRALMGVMKTDQFVKWLFDNVDSDNNNIRRATAISARELLIKKETRKDAVKILVSLAFDKDKYVTDAVSPFSLGDQLFRVDEKLAIKTLTKLSKMKSSHARRNAAAAFQSASARPLTEEACEILIKLLVEDEILVSRAAKKALNIALKSNQLTKESKKIVGPYLSLL